MTEEDRVTTAVDIAAPVDQGIEQRIDRNLADLLRRARFLLPVRAHHEPNTPEGNDERGAVRSLIAGFRETLNRPSKAKRPTQ